MRTAMLFGWLCAFYNLPEGVAAPLASEVGGGAGRPDLCRPGARLIQSARGWSAGPVRQYLDQLRASLRKSTPCLRAAAATLGRNEE